MCNNYHWITSTPLFLSSLLVIADKGLYRFGEAAGDTKLHKNDDESSTAIGVEFPFYGEMEKQLYVRGYDCYGR